MKDWASKPCGFPQGDFHITTNKTPCGAAAVETLEIEDPDKGVLSVPVCETHYYAALRLYPRDVVELVKHGQLSGQWS